MSDCCNILHYRCFYLKTLNYFSDFQNQNVSVLWLKWTRIVHKWGYWNILLSKTCFCLKVLNHIWIKNCLILKFIHRLDIAQNLFKFWARNVSIVQEAQFVNTSIWYTTDTHFYKSSIKIGSISFFPSSDAQKFHHLLGCHAIDINSSLIYF